MLSWGWDPEQVFCKWSEEQFIEMVGAARRMNEELHEESRISDNIARIKGST